MLKVESGFMVYQLTPLEIIGAFGFSPKMPLSSLKSISVQDKPWSTRVLRGIRAPGTGFPYLIMLGTMRHRRGKDFCVVYKNKPVIVLEFEGGAWARWVIPATEESKDQLSQKVTQSF